MTPVLIQFLTLHNVPLTHAADLAEIDVAISAHVAWLDKNYADAVFQASERQEPRVGGVILADGITVKMSTIDSLSTR